MARQMKDSGIAWIGEIPAEWNIGRIKYNYYLKGRIGWQGLKADEFVDEGPFLVTGTDFANGGVNWDTCYHITQERYDEAPEIHVEEHDLLITKDGTVGKVAYIENKPEQVSLNSHLLIMRPLSEGYNNKYLFWIIQSDIFYKYYMFSQNGTVMPSLSQEKINDFSFPLPPDGEQHRIADFLDAECARIDAVIEKTRASIEEYKKLKQSVITEAVTKGIHPGRKMKDSGIEWIGEIPEEWDTLSLKYLCTMQSGKNLVSEQILDSGDYPVYGGNGQRGFFSDYNNEGKCLLVGRQGALCGNVHRVDGKFWATEHAVVTINTELCNMDFLFYLLIGMNLNQYVSSTAAQPGLAVSTIQNVHTCLPCMDEQAEIASYLDELLPEVDSLLTMKEKIVSELETYKKSLIFEYVTGKKEVV